MYDARIEELKRTVSLPNSPRVATRILELAERDDAPVEEYISAICVDPVLVGRILRLANSGIVEAAPMGSINQAVMTLGLKAVKQMALSVTLPEQRIHDEEDPINFDDYWTASLICAAAARSVAHRHRRCSPAEAFTAGLLLNLGKLVIARMFPEQYGPSLSTKVRRWAAADVAEADLIGMTDTELTARILEEWNLPASTCSAVRHARDPRDGTCPQNVAVLAETLHLAGMITHLFASDSERQQDILGPLQRAAEEFFGLNVKKLDAVLKETMHDWHELGDVLVPRSSDPVGGAAIKQRCAAVQTAMNLAAQLKKPAV